MKFYTYLFRDIDGTPIYVGKGHGNRAYNHFQNHKKYHLGHLLRKRKRDGHKIEPIIHFEVDEETAIEMEKFWIKFYGRKDLGLGTLLNLTDGGEGASGRKVSEETKQKAIANKTKFKHTEETKKKMSESKKGQISPMLGRTHSNETKEKMRAVKIGKSFSEEHKINIKIAANNPEKIKKLQKPKRKIQCIYCLKIGGEPQMYQWHFDKCKEKKSA